MEFEDQLATGTDLMTDNDGAAAEDGEMQPEVTQEESSNGCNPESQGADSPDTTGTEKHALNPDDVNSQESDHKKQKLDDNCTASELQWEDGPTNVAVDTAHKVVMEETPSRRRSTRSIRRYGHSMEDDAPNNDDVDDPDYQQLSDSDDDPDFAPVNKKENSSITEFTYKGRGGKGKGRGKGSFGRGKGRRSKYIMNTQNNNITQESNENSKDGETVTSIVSTEKSPAIDYTIKRRGRPLVFFNSDANAKNTSDTVANETTTATAATTTTDAETASSVTSTTTATDSTVTAATTTTSSKTSVSMMSPSKLHSSVNYPPLKRQTLAVRLPEGPELTPEQLKEIEAQFKSGDFVMAKKDMDLDQPPIWRIDGKSLLQKFQAFQTNGTTRYRNISTYSGWTTQGKTLYVPVKAKFIFQSRYDTVVQLLDADSTEDTTAPIANTGTMACVGHSSGKTDSIRPVQDKRDITFGSTNDESIVIPDEMNAHMPTFEIFLQTLISQALDSNFLSEIYEENDEYFVERVKVIEDLADVRKEKMKTMTTWGETFRNSLEVWPSVNIMGSMSTDACEACSWASTAKLALFYGQPYDRTTLKPRENADDEAPVKNFNVCEECAKLCQTYNTVCHRKYDYYCKCKTIVTNMRVSQPSKNTTTILRELLGNDIWITGLFRAMCTSFVRIDRLSEEHSNNPTRAAPATDTLAAPATDTLATPATDTLATPATDTLTTPATGEAAQHNQDTTTVDGEELVKAEEQHL